VGILFGLITAIALTALFESLQVLEDPFTGYIALDGIDVREEFEVLLFTLLKNTRKVIWKDAPPYPLVRRAALTASGIHKNLAGVGGVATSTSPSNNGGGGGGGGITPPRVSTPSPSEHSAETTAAASMWGQFSNANENVTNQDSDNESVEFGNPLQEAEGASTVRESNYTEGGYHHARNRSRTSGGDDGKLFGLGLWASE
jgi:hypothetical protein